MARIAFIERRFNASSRIIIEQANAIINKFNAKGFSLTLRQLYYQFIANDLFPDERRFKWNGAKWVRNAQGTKNAQPNYKLLGSIINDARLAGAIDWDAIEDRTRYLRDYQTHAHPMSAIEEAGNRYIEDLWRNQECYIEAWIEKDALVGVIEQGCQQYRVPFYACRGYSSQSEQYTAGRRLRHKINSEGKRVIILHFGDHDPSGLDMTRDNQERLSMFARDDIEVRRLALTWEQVEEFNPPENPAKESDTRGASYIAQYGESSWELDALEPEYINQLLTTEVESMLDLDLWETQLAEEVNNRTRLKRVASRWDDVLTIIDEE